tara:strand:- start:1884 stop:2852 length:969 start_codon:yes stop_codon:yes gene_type:complete
MNMKNNISLWIGLYGLIILSAGCESISRGVVQEIEFPEHAPRLAVSMLCNWDSDTLVARAQSTAGILDADGSQKQKEALFTLSQSNGASYTWGGTDDWQNGVGHVFENPGLEEGEWTLTAEAPGFESVSGLQSTPPRIDTLNGAAYPVAFVFTPLEPEVDEWPEENKIFVGQIIEVELTLPTRDNAQDFFLLQPTIDIDVLGEGEYAEIRVNREFDQDPRAERLSLIDGLLVQEVAGSIGLESITLELEVEYYGENLEGYEALFKSLQVVAITPEMAAYYVSLENIENPSGFSLFSEPLLAYTNMSSGYGCFGVYRSITLPL